MVDRRIGKCLYTCFVLCLLLLAAEVTAGAQVQVTTGGLSGVVADSSGAVVPNVVIVVKSQEKGVRRSVTSDNSGRYNVGLLPPSQYSLTATAKGFREYIQNGLTVAPGETANLDITLTVGSQDEQVVVTADAELLNTSNANISENIGAKQLVDLPLNLRNVFGLATLNSSVSNTTNQQGLLGGGASSTDNADQDVSFFAFAGGFMGTSGFLLDGVWDTDPNWGATVYVPSVDAVQEFKVQNNSFTAQYGWSSGNVINVVTKSGTNAFHGSAYEFYRNSVMDANLYFNNYNHLPRKDYNRNQYGFSAGGPLYIPKLYAQRNKTFLFGLYERLSLQTPLTVTQTVPTANFRTGNFQALLGNSVGTDALGRTINSGQIYNPFSVRAITSGAVDPSTGLVATKTGYIRDPIQGNNLTNVASGISSIASKIISYYPSPTTSALTNNFSTTANGPANSSEYLIRTDHNFSDASRGYARYSYKKEEKTGSPAYWGSSDPAGAGNIRPNNRYNITLGESYILSQKMTVNFALGASHWAEVSTNQSKGFLPSTLGLPALLDVNAPLFPIVSLGGQTSMGPTVGNETRSVRNVGSVSSDFIDVIGKHTVSFGFMGVLDQYNKPGYSASSIGSAGTFTQGPDPDSPTANTGNGVAQFLLGVVDGGSVSTQFSPATSKDYYGWYVEDDWTPVHALSINLGFRYEIQTPPTYRHDTTSYFDPSIPNPIGVNTKGALVFSNSGHRGVYDTNFKNFAPRLGFAYQAAQHTTIRGGYGIFYPSSLPLLGGTTDGFSSSTGITTTLDTRTPNPSVSLSNLWPTGLQSVVGNKLGGLEDVGYSATVTFKQRASSYVQQYAVGAEFSPTPSNLISVMYIGNHGTHMLSSGINRDQLDPSNLGLGLTALNALVANPFFGSIQSSSCGLNSATVPRYRLLVPYPQYCGLTQQSAPIGASLYNSMQAQFKHRFGDGMNVQVSYTYSKFMSNVEGTFTTGYSHYAGIANAYNLHNEWSIDGGDIPQALVVNAAYVLPFGNGKKFLSSISRPADFVVGGWQLSSIINLHQGIPTNITGNNVTSFGGTARPVATGEIHAPKPNIHEWFNTAAFSFAPYGNFGTVPRYYSSLRGPGYQDFDFALIKNFMFHKELRGQFRAEAYNALNRANFYTPNMTYAGCDPNASTSCSSNFGTITSAFEPREIQVGGKFYW